MPETFKKYSVWEVAIRAMDAADQDRAQAGDVVTVRAPMPCIGLKERHNFMWLRVSGNLDDAEVSEFIDSIEDGTGETVEKRRYCIPLNRLAEMIPGFSVARAHDPGDEYQPFQIYDPDTFEKLANNMAPLMIEGLVYDKRIRRYL